MVTFNKLPNPHRVRSTEFIDSLFGVSQRNQATMLSQCLDQGPLVLISILEFVQDYDWVGVADDPAQGPASQKKRASDFGEEIKVKKAFIGEESSFLLLP